MTEPGTSLLGKTVPSLLPFLTSGLTWSAGMKSCTGRHPSLGVDTSVEGPSPLPSWFCGARGCRLL